jgi:hypothetical protein
MEIAKAYPLIRVFNVLLEQLQTQITQRVLPLVHLTQGKVVLPLQIPVAKLIQVPSNAIAVVTHQPHPTRTALLVRPQVKHVFLLQTPVVKPIPAILHRIVRVMPQPRPTLVALLVEPPYLI